MVSCRRRVDRSTGESATGGIGARSREFVVFRLYHGMRACSHLILCVLFIGTRVVYTRPGPICRSNDAITVRGCMDVITRLGLSLGQQVCRRTCWRVHVQAIACASIPMRVCEPVFSCGIRVRVNKQVPSLEALWPFSLASTAE